MTCRSYLIVVVSRHRPVYHHQDLWSSHRQTNINKFKLSDIILFKNKNNFQTNSSRHIVTAVQNKEMEKSDLQERFQEKKNLMIKSGAGVSETVRRYILLCSGISCDNINAQQYLPFPFPWIASVAWRGVIHYMANCQLPLTKPCLGCIQVRTLQCDLNCVRLVIQTLCYSLSHESDDGYTQSSKHR